MKKITLHKKNIHKGDLILINKDHPILKNNTYHEALVSVNLLRTDILLDYVAAKEFTKIISTLGCGNEIIPVSGFIPYEEQDEHSTGLAIDIAKCSTYIDNFKPNFPKRGICSKFKKIAPLFGFIERYPKKKVAVTGVNYEPWHYRYVGYPHSLIMDEMDLTMEEYISCLNSHPQDHALKFHDDKYDYDIFSIPITEDMKEIQIPDNKTFMLSGNNVDGFIMTTKSEYAW